MKAGNVLARLYIEASSAIASHDSPIADIASDALSSAANLPIVKPPNTVAQCERLNSAYQLNTSLLGTLIERHEPHLHWTDTGSGLKPKSVQDRLAYVELVGPTGMVLNDSCRAGLFFQSHNTHYPNHRHAAEELYLLISGCASWSIENMSAPDDVTAGEFVHHASWEAHAMRTGDEPMLAMWCWVGDIGFDQYEML